MALYPEGTAPLPLDDVQRAANKANELSRQNSGLNGSVVLTGTESATGQFVSLQVITTAQLTAISMSGTTGTASLAGISLAAGTVIKGDIREVNLASGTVILYSA